MAIEWERSEEKRLVLVDKQELRSSSLCCHGFGGRQWSEGNALIGSFESGIGCRSAVGVHESLE